MASTRDLAVVCGRREDGALDPEVAKVESQEEWS